MKARVPRVGSLVLVQWDDAYGTVLDDTRAPGGRFVREAELHGPDWPDVCPLETVGWIAKRTSKSLYVAQERGPRRPVFAGWRGLMRIPLRMILSIVRIA